jgi:hypothetical protein
VDSLSLSNLATPFSTFDDDEGWSSWFFFFFFRGLDSTDVKSSDMKRTIWLPRSLDFKYVGS